MTNETCMNIIKQQRPITEEEYIEISNVIRNAITEVATIQKAKYEDAIINILTEQKTEYEDEVIDKKTVLDYYKHYYGLGYKNNEFYKYLEALPSEKPFRRKAKWIKEEDKFICNYCGEKADSPYPYCPYCGANMIENGKIAIEERK